MRSEGVLRGHRTIQAVGQGLGEVTGQRRRAQEDGRTAGQGDSVAGTLLGCRGSGGLCAGSGGLV